MGKVKKGADEAVSFNLASAYSAKAPSTSMPTLDFLSKPAPVEVAPEPVMTQTPMPEINAQPVVPKATPVVPAEPVSTMAFETTAPVVEPVAPVEPEQETPVVQETSSHFTDYSSVELSSVSSSEKSSIIDSISTSNNDLGYNDPSYIAPIAPASVPAPQAYTAEGTVQMPSYDTSSIETVQISAPSKAAPERKPITPNASIVPPAPVYEDVAAPTVTLAPTRPAPVPEVSPTTPVVTVSDAGYAKLSQQPEEMPVFDSPSLNAAQANNIRQAQPASAASLNNQQYNSSTFGAAPINRPGAPMPAYRSANLNTIPASPMMPTTPATPEVDGIFDSPILNAQAKRIASGEYVPTSVASQASLSSLNERKMAPPPPGMGISRQVFGQAGYGQASGYKGPSQPLVYQEQAPIGVQPQYQAPPQYQTGTVGVGGPIAGAPNPVLGATQTQAQQPSAQFSPVYGSFNNTNGANGSNVNIPTSGNAGPGGANPLLAGNPLLVNNAR